MKKTYFEPETLVAQFASMAMMQAASGIPTFNGTPIEDDGIQSDAR